MSVEVEAAGLDSAGSWFRRRKPEHTRPPGSLCANCGAALLGPWCHACGQLAEDFHRSMRHLAFEALEGFTHFDGRFWRTVPRLITRPGQLTRDYIEGHRASQIPPLRLFLVALLLVFLVASATGMSGVKLNGGGIDFDEHGPHVTPMPKSLTLNALTPAQREAANKEIGKTTMSFGKPDDAATRWLQARLRQVVDRPEEFKLVLEQWSERFAFLMLPIAAALLTLLFVFQRRFYVYDHTIFALHSLSFQGLLLCVLFMVSWLGDWTGWLAWAAPLHLFVHMRGVYRTSLPETLARMFALFVGSLVGFTFLMLGLLWVGLSAMGAAA